MIKIFQGEVYLFHPMGHSINLGKGRMTENSYEGRKVHSAIPWHLVDFKTSQTIDNLVLKTKTQLRSSNILHHISCWAIYVRWLILISRKWCSFYMDSFLLWNSSWGIIQASPLSHYLSMTKHKSGFVKDWGWMTHHFETSLGCWNISKPTRFMAEQRL